jgi:hypothetical protein
VIGDPVIGLEIALAAAGCSSVVWLGWRKVPATLVVPNHRGRPTPVVLGLIVAASAAFAVTVVALERDARHGRVVVTGRVSTVTLALAIVFTAGLVDDLTHGGPRGLRGHLSALAEGRFSTGLLKVIAAVAGAVIVVAVIPDRTVPQRVLGAVLIAGAANLWNGFDVAPGRAGKAFLAAGAGVLAAGPAWAVAVPLLGVYGAAIPAAWVDVREHAMLGDAGANLLGLAVGAGLYTELPLWGTAVAAGAVVALNVLAETVTISRVIDAIAPLRWLDRAGRPKKSAAAE